MISTRNDDEVLDSGSRGADVSPGMIKRQVLVAFGMDHERGFSEACDRSQRIEPRGSLQKSGRDFMPGIFTRAIVAEGLGERLSDGHKLGPMRYGRP